MKHWDFKFDIPCCSYTLKRDRSVMFSTLGLFPFLGLIYLIRRDLLDLCQLLFPMLFLRIHHDCYRELQVD